MSEKLDISYSLTEEEKRILRKFKRSNSAVLTKAEFQTMLRSKLVDGVFGDEHYWYSENSFDKGVTHLTENGLRAKASMKNEKDHTTRFVVTTSLSGIAVLAAVAGVIIQLA